MFDFSPFTLGLVSCVGSFALGVVFSTKITDFFKGVPSDARTVLKSAESDVVGKLAAAKQSVITDIQTKLGVAPKVAVAPAAPLPAAVPAPVAAPPAAPAA